MTESFGCTTPFVKNISNICANRTLAKLAYDRHIDIQNGISDNLDKVCPMSCLLVTSQFKSHNEAYTGNEESEYYKSNGQLELNFQQFIKVTEAFWSYSRLSLIAEVGGYVGLLLGISVNQAHNVIEKLLMYKLD